MNVLFFKTTKSVTSEGLDPIFPASGTQSRHGLSRQRLFLPSLIRTAVSDGSDPFSQVVTLGIHHESSEGVSPRQRFNVSLQQ
jgi:hypothetical protein